MQGFVRVTKLPNIGGRAAYITNTDKQEQILAMSEPVDWQPYQEYERQNQKTYKKSNEGREVLVALPNGWAALSQEELARRVQRIAFVVTGKTTDLQWAVHWNKAHTNLHVHIIFSERQKVKEPARWDRDVYLTNDGKVARRKADRATNPDGSVKPPIHRKGDLKDGFTAKDKRYKQRSWILAMKEQLRQEFVRQGVVIDPPQPLHQYHEGKGKAAPEIREKNKFIKMNNLMYAEMCKRHPEQVAQINAYGIKMIMLKAVATKKVFCFEQMADGTLGFCFKDPARQQPERIQHQESPKTKSETILETLKGMEKALSAFEDANYLINQCKIWEVGRKKELQKRMDECCNEYEALEKTLRRLDVSDDLSFRTVWRNPDRLGTVKDRYTEQPEPKQSAARNSLQTTIDQAKRDVTHQRANEQSERHTSKPKSKDYER